MNGRLEKPLAPVFVNSNHYSIELQWDHVLVQDQSRPERRKMFDESGAARPGSLIYLQAREKKGGSIWTSIYTGSALLYKYENLKPNTQYEFRIQCKSNQNGGERSEWSPTLIASTATEPMTADTVYRAVAAPGRDQLEKLLRILGPDHPLMERPDKDGNLPLMHACTKSDLGKVELLIQAGANANSSIGTGKTPLMVAASSGFAKACAVLIENGANVTCQDQNGTSVLHHAIDSKNLETIAIIIQNLNDAKAIELNREVGLHKWTPLFRAVTHDCSKEIIELLIKNGADIECEDKTTGITVLQMAVIRSNLATTKLLVSSGADFRKLSKAGGKTLEQLALSSGKMDLISYVSDLFNPPKT